MIVEQVATSFWIPVVSHSCGRTVSHSRIVTSGRTVGNASEPRLRYILSDASGIQQAERQTIVKLKGVVFPMNAQNMISHSRIVTRGKTASHSRIVTRGRTVSHSRIVTRGRTVSHSRTGMLLAYINWVYLRAIVQ